MAFISQFDRCRVTKTKFDDTRQRVLFPKLLLGLGHLEKIKKIKNVSECNYSCYLKVLLLFFLFNKE